MIRVYSTPSEGFRESKSVITKNAKKCWFRWGTSKQATLPVARYYCCLAGGNAISPRGYFPCQTLLSLRFIFHRTTSIVCFADSSQQDKSCRLYTFANANLPRRTSVVISDDFILSPKTRSSLRSWKQPRYTASTPPELLLVGAAVAGAEVGE